MKKIYWNIQNKEITFYLNWFENILMKRILVKHNYNISRTDEKGKTVIVNKEIKYNKKHIKTTKWLCDYLWKNGK